MGRFAKQLKNKLNGIIDEMAGDPSLFVRMPGKDFIRSRKLGFSDMLRLLVSCGGNSLNKEIRDFVKPKGYHVTSSAFVQQRDKILPEALEFLLHEFNSVCHDTKLWNGYRLLAVDGTTMTYARDPEAETFMPDTGNGVNQYHVNAMYDLLNKTYADVIIQPQPEMNEPEAAWQMMERMTLTVPSIMTADRGYGGVNLIEHINRTENAEYLIRIKNALWKELKDIPMAAIDTDITINLRTTATNEDKAVFASGDAKWIAGHGKYKALEQATWDFESPYSLTIRIVRFKITDDTYETIATSLPREKFPLMMIKHLYHLRWGIETSFRELKYAIGVTNFHAKKGSSVLQEIYARLVMYNFCERLTLSVVIKQKDNRKWMYQANYTMGIYISREYFRYIGDEPPDDPEEEISRYILPVRPGRTDKRKMNNKTAVYFIYRVA